MQRGLAARKQGAYRDALQEFETAIRIASEAHNLVDEAAAISRQSGCFIRLFQYRQALAMANAARDMGEQIHDDEVIGIADNNRSVIYQQTGDFALAEAAAREAIEHLALAGPKEHYVAAITNLGDVLSQSGQTAFAIQAFTKAIALARDYHVVAVEATAQDRLGSALIDVPDYQAASQHFQQAYQLFKAARDPASATMTLGNIAGVLYLTGDYAGSLRTLNRVAGSRSFIITGQTPFWEPDLRGRALVGLHRPQEALLQFQKAIRAASEWRRFSLPSDASSTRTLVMLHEVYQNYLGLATDLAIREHNTALSRQALSVLIDHRASTLREQMVASLGKQMNLPPRYFELLSRIQAAQAVVTLGADGKDAAAKRTVLAQLQNQLAEVENSVGLNGPNPAHQTAETGTATLAQIQKRLPRQELLLSFFLGKEKSFVWAVTNDKVAVYDLPAENAITEHAKAFSQAARHGSAKAAGETLRQDLFGKLDADMQSRPEWLVAADGALLDSVPFSALPEKAGTDTPLSMAHSLRFTPSELLLLQNNTSPIEASFVGVADPIYNMADTRSPRKINRTAPRVRAGITLARLVASEREVRTAIDRKGFDQVQVLSGQTANDQNLRAVLAKAPEVLHFAVHVISPETADGIKGEEAALALSLGPDGFPQLLTKEIISSLRVPGTLVVLSGCASQQGKPLPSAGLMGLSRAWLLAGASAVLVTAWPTPDDSGAFFGNFYSHLQAQPRSTSIARRAASALQATQIDMQHSQDYMSETSFWAAYSLISKE
jgi:CHAT domain-containing protein